MNFEGAYKKVIDGTATPEEKAFVEGEMEKIRRISEILESSPEPSVNVVASSDEDDIKQAKMRYKKKTTVKIIVISLASLIAIAAIVCGIIFIPSITSARRNEKITEEEAMKLAEEFLSDYTDEDATKFVVRDVDKELRMKNGLSNSIFNYEIEFKSPEGIEYTVEVSSKSGYVMLTDIDR